MLDKFDISSTTILVADDNPMNLKVMESMLEEFGCEVRVALDGESALRSARTLVPDLILLDVHMPKLDGFATCKQLKEDKATMDVPVLFVTALSDEFNKVAGLELGAADYIVKPIEFEELRARIGVHLQLAKAMEALREQAEDLRSLNDTMMGRELRMLELKHEVNELSRELGREDPYPESEDGEAGAAH